MGDTSSRGQVGGIRYLRGIEVDEEEIDGAHCCVKVALVQLQHWPITGDLEFLWLLTIIIAHRAAPRPHKAEVEEEEEGKEQPLPREQDNEDSDDG
jgi:hypothetical protein